MKAGRSVRRGILCLALGAAVVACSGSDASTVPVGDTPPADPSRDPNQAPSTSSVTASELRWAESTPHSAPSVTAGWKPASGAASQAVRVFKGASCIGDAATETIGATESRYAVNGAFGDTYAFQIETTSANGEKATSTCSSAMELRALADPTIAAISAPEATKLRVMLGAPADARVSQIRVGYSMTGVADCRSPEAVAVDMPMAGSPFVDLPGLTAGTTYAVHACSVRTFADGAASHYSTGVAGTKATLAALPTEVSGLTATQEAPASIRLTWAAAPSAVSYLVTSATGSTVPAASCAGGQAVAGTELVISGLTLGTRYNLRVCAKNGNPVPDITTGATVVRYLSSPPAPEVLDLTTANTQARTLSFTWSSANGAAGKYRVSFGAALPAVGCPGGTETTQTTASFSGLTPSTTYRLRICAMNGDSEPLVTDGMTIAAKTSALPADFTITGPSTINKYLVPGQAFMTTITWTDSSFASQGFVASIGTTPTCAVTYFSGTTGVGVTKLGVPLLNLPSTVYICVVAKGAAGGLKPASNNGMTAAVLSP